MTELCNILACTDLGRGRSHGSALRCHGCSSALIRIRYDGVNINYNIYSTLYVQLGHILTIVLTDFLKRVNRVTPRLLCVSDHSIIFEIESVLTHDCSQLQFSETLQL